MSSAIASKMTRLLTPRSDVKSRSYRTTELELLGSEYLSLFPFSLKTENENNALCSPKMES